MVQALALLSRGGSPSPFSILSLARFALPPEAEVIKQEYTDSAEAPDNVAKDFKFFAHSNRAKSTLSFQRVPLA